MNKNEAIVALHALESRGYPQRAPYDPGEAYPEYHGRKLDPDNEVYGAVRLTLHKLGLDYERFGSPEWNPLGELIEPGMTVFIKPNTVSHLNLARKDLFAVIVHASVLRPVLDYACKALQGRGRIIIGDSQLIMSEFEPAMKLSGITDMLAWYRQQTAIPIECFDLRLERVIRTYLYGRWGRKKVEQDPRGYQVVDLADESYFRGIDPSRLRIAVASYKAMYQYHSEGRHQYVFPRSFLESDVVINIPKLKTHRRTAVTLALKNYMGIPAFKDSLPHFITGASCDGGDQYIHPSRRKEICLWLHDQIQSSPYVPMKFMWAVIKKLIWNSSKIIPFRDNVYEAMWPGNDTLWRTLLDLNRIVMYADRNGKLQDQPQRKQLHLIDGIIGGAGDGPLSPDPVDSRVLLAGFNAACIDAVATMLMGFDFEKVPLIARGLGDAAHKHPVCSIGRNEIEINTGTETLTLDTFKERHNLHFAPHPNWVGQIELARRAKETVVACGGHQ